MGFMRRVMAYVGWTICAVLSGPLEAQSRSGPATSQTPLYASSAAQSSDGTPVYTTPHSTPDDVLKEMASRAAVIFIGTVSAVKKSANEELHGNVASSVVEVDFVVDQAVAGVGEGTTYVMREWAGLWRDSPRFVAGQRVLALLHGPGPGGLSSPVDGLDGVLPITVTTSPADISFSALATSTMAKTSPEQAVDIRWLQAKTLKTLNLIDAPTAGPGETVVGALTSVQTQGIAGSSVTAQTTVTAGVSHVLGLLRTQQETRNVAH